MDKKINTKSNKKDIIVEKFETKFFTNYTIPNK